MHQPQVVDRLRHTEAWLRALPPHAAKGRVAAATGAVIELAGLAPLLALGDRVDLIARGHRQIPAEIVALRGGRAQAMPLGPMPGIGLGAEARLIPGAGPAALSVHDSWLGRVIDPLGAPIDGRGALASGPPRPVRAMPPPAARRERLGPRIGLGVRVLDLFTTCRAGQRLGLFAGSGVGKSTLLAMLARHASCDVVVLALVGERGREVREFIEDDLGPAMPRCVAVVATSDQAPLLRREAAYAAMTVAEHFRDQGRSVLLLMDSVTRFCLALREIGLSAGEPPATRGYPPSMFAELPCLLERAGPGPSGSAGSITGLFTVLVEGGDHNEPIADAVRGILDGHAVLDRRIAESGRFPAIDVLRSISRTVPGCLDQDQAALARRARATLATAAELSDLVRLGAYRPGTDPAADEALRIAPRIESLLQQDRAETAAPGCDPVGEAFVALSQALGGSNAG